MEDSRNPLTAGEIEDVQNDVKIINEFLELCSHRLDPWNMARVADAVAWLGVDKGKIVEWVHGYWDGEDVERKMMDMEKENARLLSILTPPQDAAVREAVERLDNSEYTIALDGSRDDTAQMWEDIDTLIAHTLLRAAQTPRLITKQVECLKNTHIALTTNGLEGAAWELRAAFPELAGEV